MVNKIYLGKVKEDFNPEDKYNCVRGESLYLEKHKFDCGWYWGFGYIGNRNLHTHMDSTFLNGITGINEIFEESTFTQKEWWIIRDLFIQAYALKNCAKVYRHGGHQTSEKGLTGCIKSKEMEDQINKDLERVLNQVWDFMTRDRSEIAETFKRIESIKAKITKQENAKTQEEDKLKKLESKLWEEEKKDKLNY
jgi:hypothetical protein